MLKLIRVLAVIGVAALVFGGGIAVGAGGGTTVVGSPEGVQLFNSPVTSTFLPTPQPDTTPFPIVQAAPVTVDHRTHAVVSLEAPTLSATIFCQDPNSGTRVYGHMVLSVDGQTMHDLGSTFGSTPLVWTPTIGPGTHSVALSLVCPAGTGNNASDAYFVTGSPNPIRVEVLKVP